MHLFHKSNGRRRIMTVRQQVACSLERASHAELKRQTTDALVAVVQPIREDITRLLDDKRCVPSSFSGALCHRVTLRSNPSQAHSKCFE